MFPCIEMMVPPLGLRPATLPMTLLSDDRTVEPAFAAIPVVTRQIEMSSALTSLFEPLV